MSSLTDFSLLYFQIGILSQLNYYQKPNQVFLNNKWSMAFTDMLCRFTISYEAYY